MSWYPFLSTGDSGNTTPKQTMARTGYIPDSCIIRLQYHILNGNNTGFSSGYTGKPAAQTAKLGNNRKYWSPDLTAKRILFRRNTRQKWIQYPEKNLRCEIAVPDKPTISGVEPKKAINSKATDYFCELSVSSVQKHTGNFHEKTFAVFHSLPIAVSCIVAYSR